MTEDIEPLVSVVTPIYNGEEYLSQCIESVLEQTFDDFEYLIVDNCSTDRSREIAGEYAARDPRIRLSVNDRFLSAIENWNQALRQISPASRYVKVVHVDDYLMESCLERMVGLAEAHPSVGLVSSYRLQNDRVENDGLPYPRSVFPGQEVGRDCLLGGDNLFGNPSATLLRSEIVRSRNRFYSDEVEMLSDRESYLYALREHDFGFVYEVLTYTREHGESITASISSKGVLHPEMLFLLQKWGPVFLGEDELAREFEDRLERYMSFLGKNAFYFRDREFWAYHRDWLERLGRRLTGGRLAWAAAREVGRVLLKPAVTGRKAFEFIWDTRS